ncbi:s-layer protein [Leptolyngbya sp. Heron Island J]|uniref:hypothetical protein n=1 Tax=Leptolyngbya sp. Heron Island J TaxID=1385935 RepID=UPI0003B9F1CD|nr:hypothetical protein [Leptolyngbya sp. Heron Island J]ESA35825.1 s-layer protein [Leptolyngbya sp. Heron Island J]
MLVLLLVFRPNNSITRLEALLVLRRATDFTAPEPEQLLSQYFQDADEIPEYPQQALADVAIGRVVVNYPDVQELRSQLLATRGEIAAFLCQATRRTNVLPLEFVARGPAAPFAIPRWQGFA